MTTTETVNGITYKVDEIGRNIHTRRPYYMLTKIGKTGRPTKQTRPATRHDDGTWHLRAWTR